MLPNEGILDSGASHTVFPSSQNLENYKFQHTHFFMATMVTSDGIGDYFPLTCCYYLNF